MLLTLLISRGLVKLRSVSFEMGQLLIGFESSGLLISRGRVKLRSMFFDIGQLLVDFSFDPLLTQIYYG